MTDLSDTMMNAAHVADVWLRSWQGSLRWKAALAVSVVCAIGSLFNVVVAERIDTKLHKAAGVHLRAGSKPDAKEMEEAHADKEHSINLKAWARIWTAVAILASALALFLKPEP